MTFCAYGQSKTANMLHVMGLRGRGVGAFAVHPGSEYLSQCGLGGEGC